MVVYLLSKRTVEVLFVRSFDRTARASPSTFLFLPSSHCQRADPNPFSRAASLEAQASEFFREQSSAPGCPAAHPALSETVDQWERLARVVNGAGCSRDRKVCQHPDFSVRQVPSAKTPRAKNFPLSVTYRSVTALARRCLSDGRVIGTTPHTVKDQNHTKCVLTKNIPRPTPCSRGARDGRACASRAHACA
jgi:hypothetical protein